jgi:hypothetical protein
MFVALVFNFAIIQPIMDVIGADGFAWGFGILFWLDLLASIVVVVGLILGWRLARPVWAQGLVPAALGLVVHWGWWKLNKAVDLWGFNRYAADGSGIDPELLRLGVLATGVSIAVSVAAIALLTYGGVRILRSPLPTPEPEPTEG